MKIKKFSNKPSNINERIGAKPVVCYPNNNIDENSLNILHIARKNLIKKKLPGSIVNISSIVGQIGFDELSSYGSSKGALISLTKCFAVEMAKKKIRANSVSPGFTKTSFFKSFKKDKKKLYSWTLSRIPQNRWGESKEISELIYFLISENSNYINGENINIDGGWLSA